MTALAILGAVVLLAAGAGFAWYLDSRAVLVGGGVVAALLVSTAFVLRPSPAPREGVAVLVDDSCDAPVIGEMEVAAVRDVLTPGVNGTAAVVLGWFADNAASSRRFVLDLTEEPPLSVHGDSVAYANWKAPRAREAEHALTRLRTRPCRRVGTSVIGAVAAAADVLDDAGVNGRRRIVLVTNLVEYSQALEIEARSFGPDDVEAAVQAVARVPRKLRPTLGDQTRVTVLFTPSVRVNGRTIPLAERTAVALELWATRTFREVLRAGSVDVEIVAQTA